MTLFDLRQGYKPASNGFFIPHNGQDFSQNVLLTIMFCHYILHTISGFPLFLTHMISILHDHVTAILHGQSKIFFFFQNKIWQIFKGHRHQARVSVSY